MVVFRRMTGALVVILLIGGISTLVAIGSIGGSDSCGGCDRTPTWAYVGMYAFLVLGGLWCVCAVGLTLRWLASRRQSG